MEGHALKKQHNVEYIAIGALVVAALILGITRFKKSNAEDEVFSRKEFKQKLEEIEALEAKVPKKEKQVDYAVKDEMFPFKSLFDEAEEIKEDVDEAITLPSMQCQGMVWKSSRPQTIINNKVYDINDIINVEGDVLGGDIEVKAITKEGVYLIYKKKEFIVRPK